MSPHLDSVEFDYERAIALAERTGDNDLAAELAVGLKQYRERYQTQGADSAITLDAMASQRFAGMLLDPPEPNEALRQLMAGGEEEE